MIEKYLNRVINDDSTNKLLTNVFVCLVCGSRIDLHKDHPANHRAHGGIVYRASCDRCYIKPSNNITKTKQHTTKGEIKHEHI